MMEYIAIEGNIGSGKTSICRKLAEELNADLILERFEENEFLAEFYREPNRNALPLELWFMAERYKQLSTYFQSGNIFYQKVFADYVFDKTILFAQNNLNHSEFHIFSQVFKLLKKQMPRPEYIIYLHRPVEVLLMQIEKRGREYEKNIASDYLSNLHSQYDTYLRSLSNMDILYCHLGEKDFLNESRSWNLLLTAMNERKRDKGIEYVYF